MFRNENGRSTIVLLLVVVIFSAALLFIRYAKASAQDQQQPPLGQMMPGMQGMPGMGGMMQGMPGPGMMPGMMPGMNGSPAIAVSDGYVFVVQGNRLSKFNAKTLELAKSVDINPMPKVSNRNGEERMQSQKEDGSR